MKSKLEKVWDRKEELLTVYCSCEKGVKNGTGCNVIHLTKVCKEEGVTLKEFTEYAQNRVKEA